LEQKNKKSPSVSVIENPFVSVGLITFERDKLLVESLKSVLQQSYKNFEVIVSNDNPNRKINFKTLAIKKDKRVKIVNQTDNLGEIGNLNYVLKNSVGDYFTWLADDEVLYPQFLERCVLALQKHDINKISAVYPFYDSGELLSARPPPKKKSLKVALLDTEKLGLWYFNNTTKIIGIYGLLSRIRLIQLGGFLRLGTGFGPYSDNLIPFKLSTLGDILILHEKLYFYRLHPTALSVASTDIQSYWTAEVEFLKEIQNMYRHFNARTMRSIQRSLIKLFMNYSFSVLARGNNLRWPMKKRWLKHCLANYPRPRPIFSNLWSMLRQALIILSSHR